MEKEILLQQRFVYAEIEPYRNYSRLVDKPEGILNSTFDTDDVFSTSKVKIEKQLSFNIDSKNGGKYKNTKYFYSGEDVSVNINLKPYSNNEQSYVTTSDRQIKSHFANPFSTVKIYINERTIILNGDKLTVKLDYYTKLRNLNAKYYKRIPCIVGFSINLKTGDITTFNGVHPRLKIRRNSFIELLINIRDNNLIEYETIIGNSKKRRKTTEYHRKFYDEFRKNLNDEEFIRTLHRTLSGYLPLLPLNHNLYDVDSNSNWLHKTLLWFLVDKKGIKVPNEYYLLMSLWYPTMKYLKKNNMKLIVSILDRLGIKSKTTIKIMHEHPKLDVRMIMVLVKYFGKEDLHKFISNLNPEYFKLKIDFRSASLGSLTKYELFKNEIKDEYQLNKNEKGNILKLINEFVVKSSLLTQRIYVENIDGFLNDITDHCNMIVNLKKYYPNLTINASTRSEFIREHAEYSALTSKIRKGYTLEYIFDEELINHIEQPISVYNNLFYPVLLKTDNEYTEEGNFMHHCVGSYSNYDKSIIISLRLDSTSGNDRVTSEFDIYTKKCRQSKYFCNQRPPEIYIEPLELLKERILNYHSSIGSKEKKKTIININGIPVIKELPLEF